MSIDRIRASITSRIWQSIAQSGVDLSSVPRDQLNTLVDTIAENMLLEVNQTLDSIAPNAPSQAVSSNDTASVEQHEEQILWEGRPFLSLVEHYQITTERIRITRGLLSKDRDDIELFRLQSIDHTQNLSERMINIGDITLHTGQEQHEDFVLRNVSSPTEVHEIIRKAMLSARQRHRVGVRDDV
jgi:hypothetical protein